MIKYSDLKPSNATFVLNEVEYELRPFDLAARVWANDEFATETEPNGLVNLSKTVQDMTSFSAVYKCAWHLLKRKRSFGFYENFLKEIDKDEHKITADIYKAFVRTLGVSEPQLDNFKEELELKKSLAALD